MSDYRTSIAEALGAVEVVSPTTFTWFGAPSRALPAETVQLMDGDSTREYLLYNLQAQLYANFYCAGKARPQLGISEPEPTADHAPFIRALSEANTGKGARESGWTVVGEDAGAVVVVRDGLSLWIAPSDVYRVDGAAIVPGASVGVLMPKELLRLSPGFYMALGDAEFPVDGTVSILRFYWSLRSEGAPALIGALTSRLNADGIAFRVKVASDPGAYSRCDAGVLYTRRDDHERLRSILTDVYETLAPLLRPTTPALTKQLMPGLGLAEDPGEHDMSFGMNRCKLLAEGILEAHARGIDDPAGRLDVVQERFARDGITVDAPYLSQGSADCYELPG